MLPSVLFRITDGAVTEQCMRTACMLAFMPSKWYRRSMSIYRIYQSERREIMYNIVNIERQFACGGNEIARKLAAELGYRYHGHDILEEAVNELGISYSFVSAIESTDPESDIFNIHRTPLNDGGLEEKDYPIEIRLFNKVQELIKKYAAEGKCVFVGRAASFILKDTDGCLNAYIYADEDYRLQRAMSVEGIDSQKAAASLIKNDRRRSNFYNANTHRQWGDKKNYSIMLNSGILGTEECVRILSEIVRGSRQ